MSNEYYLGVIEKLEAQVATLIAERDAARAEASRNLAGSQDNELHFNMAMVRAEDAESQVAALRDCLVAFCLEVAEPSGDANAPAELEAAGRKALADTATVVQERDARLIAEHPVVRAAINVRQFMVRGAAPAPGIVEATVWLYLDQLIEAVDALAAGKG